MLTSVVLAVSLAAVAFAEPVPLEPYGATVELEGTDCTIIWDADTTGTWTTMGIELMTGSNLNQVHLKTVAIVDGTDPDITTFTYPCPDVTPNSAIYFYKFTSPFSTEPLFTTRFTIADADGDTVTPTGTETAANGDPVQWGVGALTNPEEADEPPNFQGISASNPPPTSTPTSTPAPEPSIQTSTTRTGTQTTSETTTSSLPDAGTQNLPLGGMALGLLAGFFGMLVL